MKGKGVDRGRHILIPWREMDRLHRRFWQGAVSIVALLFGFAAGANATVIDFNGIPDGTLVSAGNPYGGVLNLQATVQWVTVAGTFSAEGTISTAAPFYPAGDGVVQALPPLMPDAGDYKGDVMGTFLQPVTDASFDAFVFRTAGYSYTGANGLGDIFMGSGSITGNIESGGLLTWQQINLTLPAGYHLTSFDVQNHDPNPPDGAVWLDNVAFTVVPEPSATALLGLGGMLLLVFARRTLRDRPC
jgi:hypothetical protein